jgi:hypothetical protein
MLLERSEAETVVYGATSSLRSANIEGIDAMTGFLINWVPVVQERGLDDGNWLRDFQEEQTVAQAHSFAPPRSVHDWSRAGCDWPLYDTVVTVQNYPGASHPIESGGLVLRTVFAREQVHYPLSLVARPGDEALTLELTYDDRRVDADLAGSLLNQVLAALLSGADRLGVS